MLLSESENFLCYFWYWIIFYVMDRIFFYFFSLYLILYAGIQTFDVTWCNLNTSLVSREIGSE